MKTLYIECKMGAAGDMLTSALLELLPEEEFNEAVACLQNIGLDGVEFSVEKTAKCGISGTHVTVKINGEEEAAEHHHHQEEHEHHHHHHSMKDITETVSGLKIPDSVKNAVLKVYNLLAQAESQAHGVEVNQIHFHEVGNKDAIMDITSVCYLMMLIGAEKIVASPINVGSGTVRCAHGILPVPAPATEYLLRGIPYYQNEIQSELCTPTGAALLKYFAADFGPMPEMIVEKTGIGLGKKDFETANCIRVFLGETKKISDSEKENSELSPKDKILQLEANVDDMTAEEIGFAMDRFFEAGAREAFTSSVYMKKNRPGTLVTVICSEEKKDEIVKTIFKYTTTIGIRQKVCQRYVLKRENEEINTDFGVVHKKNSSGYGIHKSKFEYDDLAKIALEKGLSLDDIRKLIEK